MTPCVEVTALHAGDLVAPEVWVFRPPARSTLRNLRDLVRPRERVLELPLLAFLVRHPTEGTMIVDTGLHRAAIEDLRSDYGWLNGLFFRTLRPTGNPFDEQLREHQVEPEEVRLVVMTHLHADHTSGMRLLPRARFVCSSAEWAAATKPRSALSGYVSSHLSAASDLQLVDVEDGGKSHGGFTRTIDLLGDGTMRLVSTPGHSPGHLSVLLQADSGPILLIGDAVYTLRSLRENRLPMRTVDDHAYLNSMEQIRHFAAAHPQATLIPTHDQHAWRQLRPPSAVGTGNRDAG